MPRFIIVDPSLCDYSGHHWEYSHDIALAALKAGFEAEIWSNRKLDRLAVQSAAELRAQGVVLRCFFTQTIYQSGGGPRSTRAKLDKSMLHSALHTPVRAVSHLLNQIGAIDPEYAALVARVRETTAALRLPDAVKKAARYLLGVLMTTLVYLPALTFASVRRRRISGPKETRFTAELTRALRKHRLSPDDILYIHTAAPDAVHETQQALLQIDLSAAPTVFVLLRYDEQSLPRESYFGIHHPIRRFSRMPYFNRKFYLLAETISLGEFYSEGRDGIVHVLEHSVPDSVVRKLPEWQHGKVSKTKRRSIVFLGSAREEKGFEHLPDVVAAVAREQGLKDEWMFKIQCNTVNENLTPVVRRAIQELEGHSGVQVEMVKEPLSSEEFAACLASASICLLPYSKRAYGRRGSGLFVAALAAGVRVVVPQDTWMARRLPPDCGETFADESELVSAVIRLATNVQCYEGPITQAAEEWLHSHTAAAAIDQLLELRDLKRRVSGPAKALSVLHIAPLWLRQGSTKVFEAQLDYLTNRGHHVYSVGIITNLAYSNTYAEEVNEVGGQVVDRPVTFAWYLAPVVNLRRLRTVWRLLRAKNELDRELARRDMLDIPHSLACFVDQNKIDLIVLNYLQNHPLLRRLSMARHVPLVVETIDIQSNLMDQYEAHGDLDEMRHREVEVLGKCSAIIALNRSDHDYLKKALPSRDHHLIYPFADLVRDPARELSFCECTGDVISAAGPRWALQTECTEQYDLLYVGALHTGNVDGLRWFLAEVFPKLDHNLNLLVAGSIVKGLKEHWENPRVRFVGEVEDPGPLYAAARVVVIPMRLGTGISVKLLETMARSRPFVASAPAFRGIDPEDLHGAGIVAHRAPGSFADEVTALLGDKAKRMLVAEAGFAYAARHFSRTTYLRKWDEAVASLCPGVTVSEESQPAVSRPTFRYWEWTTEDRLLARAVRHVLTGSAWSTADVISFERSWLQSAVLKKELQRRVALLDGAPLAARSPRLSQAFEQAGSTDILGRLLKLGAS